MSRRGQQGRRDGSGGQKAEVSKPVVGVRIAGTGRLSGGRMIPGWYVGMWSEEGEEERLGVGGSG